MSHSHCVVQGCKNTIFNKPVGVSFHACPFQSELRNKWLQILKNKCSILDWNRSRICSKHFENKYFDSRRKLKDNAVPTIFPTNLSQKQTNSHVDGLTHRTTVDRRLNKLTQAELMANIKSSLSKMKEPENLEDYMDNDFKCKPNTPTEAQLWLLVKKQDHLNTRLTELVVQNKQIIETLNNKLDKAKDVKKEFNHEGEHYKYVIKSLQEKLATLEEQIEIIATVESPQALPSNIKLPNFRFK